MPNPLLALIEVQPATQGPSLVHYLPIATTALSVGFVVMLMSRASRRQWAPHLLWWAFGIFFYGAGTAVESAVTLFGNSPELNRLWYWLGAILGAYPLGVGSCYLLLRRSTAHHLTLASLAFVAFASAVVLTAPINPEVAVGHRTTRSGFFESELVGRLTVPINLYAAAFLIGGAIWSSVTFALFRRNPKRALGTGLIAVGAILPGIGGTLVKLYDWVEALYVGELSGLILIVIGYMICLRAPKPIDSGAATPQGSENTGADDAPRCQEPVALTTGSGA